MSEHYRAGSSKQMAAGALFRDGAGRVFPDGEILSASFHTLAQTHRKVLAPLAYRLEAALEALRQGVTALCEQGRRTPAG